MLYSDKLLSGGRREPGRTLILVACLAAYTLVFYKTAWVADDAFISFRVVENLLRGDGPVWNVGERVQVYTHPLWFFLLSMMTYVIKSVYWASILLSLFFGFLTVRSLVVISVSVESLALTLLFALSSKSFVDFMSSGLEVPLVVFLHFLLIVSCFNGRSTRCLIFIASLLFLTRPDTVVLSAPLIAYGAYNNFALRNFLKDVFLGAWPAAIWLLFSFFYYGNIFPNTALAKAGSGMSLYDSYKNAFSLVSWLFKNDIITIALFSYVLSMSLFSGRSFYRVLSVSLVLWFIYIAHVGGDYMGGRFFVIPMSACFFIVATSSSNAWFKSRVGVLVIFLFIPYLSSTVLSSRDYSDFNISNGGLANERGFYYLHTGLRRNISGYAYESHPWYSLGENLDANQIVVACNIGLLGYASDPTVHIVDPLGLADPFLSRLPAREDSRIGHYERSVVPDYLKSVISNENQFQDKNLGELWRLVKNVTQGDLFSWARVIDIVSLNLNYRRLVIDSSTFEKNDIYLGSALVDKSSTHKLTCLGSSKMDNVYQTGLSLQGEIIFEGVAL